MESTFHRSVVISLFLHTLVFFITSISVVFRKNYITIPVELIYYTPPQVSPKEVKEIKKEEEIVLPKRRKQPLKRKEKPEEKERKQEEPRPLPSPSALQPSSTLTPETAKFPYMYYLRNIRERISNNWRWSEEADAGVLKTVVYFKIYRDGSINEPVFKEKSGDSVFDSLAIRAIKISAPFPPLPSGYEEDTLGVYFEFAYRE